MKSGPVSGLNLGRGPVKTNFDLQLDDPYYEELTKVVEPAITLFLRKNLTRVLISIEVRACRRGVTYDTAKPTIFVSCTNPAVVNKALRKFHKVDRKRINLKIEKNDISVVGAGDDNDDHQDQYTLWQGRLGNSQSSSGLKGVYGPAIPSRNERSILYMGTLVKACRAKGEAYVCATIGGCILLNGKRYALTVGHICTAPPAEESTHRYNYEDEEQDYSDWGSEDSDTETDDQQFSDPGSRSDSSDVGSHLEDTEFIYPNISQVLRSVNSPNSKTVHSHIFSIDASGGERHLGHLYKTSEAEEQLGNGTEYYMDWALVKLDANIEISNALLPHYIYPSSTISSPEMAQGREVIVIAGSSRNVRGKMKGSCSLLLPGKQRFWRYWRAELETRLVKGDSGSWVLDYHELKVLGVVHAASYNESCAYIVPIEEVLNDIRVQCHANSVRISLEEPISSTENRALLSQLEGMPKESATAATTEERERAIRHPSLPLHTTSDPPSSIDYYKDLLAERERVLGQKHPSTLRTMNALALCFARCDDHTKALYFYQRAVAGYEEVLGREHASTLSTINNIANVFSAQAKYNDALQWYRRALSGKAKILGGEHRSTLRTVNNMAVVLSHQGKYDEALKWYEQVLVRTEKILGVAHMFALEIVHNMGVAFDNQGKHDKAMECYQRALNGRETSLGMTHLDTLSTVNNMAVVLYNQRRYHEALMRCEQALDGYTRARLGNEHPLVLDVVNNMGNVLSAQNKHDEAMRWYQRALAGYERTLGQEHPLTLGVIHNIAKVFAIQAKYDEAFEWYGHALVGKKKALGEEHPSTLKTIRGLEVLQRALSGKPCIRVE